MTNIYVLAFKQSAKVSIPGILTFTNKKTAIEWARYYHYTEHYYYVSLRLHRQNSCGVGSPDSYVNFYK